MCKPHMCRHTIRQTDGGGGGGGGGEREAGEREAGERGKKKMLTIHDVSNFWMHCKHHPTCTSPIA